MIHDLSLRWIVTALFVFSAGVCLRAIVRNRHSPANLVSHSLHAVMAVAMAVMAWPRGADLPTRAPMIFFLGAAVWFAVVAVRSAGHRLANVYHLLMMAAMAWMYAAMGGLPIGEHDRPASAATSDRDAAGMAGHAGHTGHTGHGGHSTGMSASAEPAWVGALNWVCTVGFAAAAVYWLYRLVIARLRPSVDGSESTVGLLCQLAMAVGMAVMFGVML